MNSTDSRELEALDVLRDLADAVEHRRREVHRIEHVARERQHGGMRGSSSASRWSKVTNSRPRIASIVIRFGYVRGQPRGSVAPWKLTSSPASAASVRIRGIRDDGLAVAGEEVDLHARDADSRIFANSARASVRQHPSIARRLRRRVPVTRRVVPDRILTPFGRPYSTTRFIPSLPICRSQAESTSVYSSASRPRVDELLLHGTTVSSSPNKGQLHDALPGSDAVVFEVRWRARREVRAERRLDEVASNPTTTIRHGVSSAA